MLLGDSGIFHPIKIYLVLDKIQTDNSIFKLHYKATFLVLACCSILVTARQYIGDPIRCLVEKIPQDAIDTFCWIHTTHSVYSEKSARDMPHYGIAAAGGVNNEAEVRYHKYYQWVCFTLIFQAFLFCVPRYVWHAWEGGMMGLLAQNLSDPLQGKDTRRDELSLLVKYFSVNRSDHMIYAAKFMICEVLNFVNVVGQMYFMDYFFGGHFASYGLDALAVSEVDARTRTDAMSRLFPKMTKCTFHKYGPSGTIEKIDALCVMPLNNVNEKIYIFIWFWFIFVAVASAGQLLLRLASALVPRVRRVLLRARLRLAQREQVDAICDFANFGEWLLLYQIGKNVDPLAGRDFARGLYPQIRSSRENINSVSASTLPSKDISMLPATK
jgi:hypothetical protein